MLQLRLLLSSLNPVTINLVAYLVTGASTLVLPSWALGQAGGQYIII